MISHKFREFRESCFTNSGNHVLQIPGIPGKAFKNPKMILTQIPGIPGILFHKIPGILANGYAW